MKTQTNKALVKKGFTSEMFGQVIEAGLNNETELFHNINLTGDEESTILYVEDFKGREFEIVIYDKQADTIYMNTRNVEDEDFEEKNSTSVKSIGALFNKMMKMAQY